MVNELGILTVDPHDLVNRCVRDYDIFQDQIGFPVGQWPHTQQISPAPHSWFYGVQFTDETLLVAANNLIERGYLATRPQTMGGRPGRQIEMTAKGEGCVERFDGDPDEMEAIMTGIGNNVNITNFTQHGGNTAFSSTIGSQTSTTNTLTVGQTAKDPAALMQAIRERDGIPDDEIEEASDIENSVIAGSTESDQQATEAVGRARRFFQCLGKVAELATQALFAAAGNYAALRLGIASP